MLKHWNSYSLEQRRDFVSYYRNGNQSDRTLIDHYILKTDGKQDHLYYTTRTAEQFRAAQAAQYIIQNISL